MGRRAIISPGGWSFFSFLLSLLLFASTRAFAADAQSLLADLASEDPKVRLTAVAALPAPGPERTGILSLGLMELI